MFGTSTTGFDTPYQIAELSCNDAMV